MYLVGLLFSSRRRRGLSGADKDLTAVRVDIGLRVTAVIVAWYHLQRAVHSVDGKQWRRGVVATVVRRMNEVTLRRARLVLGWVTVFGRVYHHGM